MYCQYSTIGHVIQYTMHTMSVHYYKAIIAYVECIANILLYIIIRHSCMACESINDIHCLNRCTQMWIRYKGMAIVPYRGCFIASLLRYIDTCSYVSYILDLRVMNCFGYVIMSANQPPPLVHVARF